MEAGDAGTDIRSINCHSNSFYSQSPYRYSEPCDDQDPRLMNGGGG